MVRIDGEQTTDKTDPKGYSKIFRIALLAVKNMKDIFYEPLPGRKPSAHFWEALEVVKKGFSSKNRGE